LRFLDFVVRVAIEVRASAGELLASGPGKDDLKKLQSAGAECGDGSGEIKPPGADEI
jgi:hypothetical protein